MRHQRDDLAIAIEPAPIAAAADDAQALADMVAMPDTGTRGLGGAGRADLAADAVIGRYLRMAGAAGLLDRRPSGDGDGNALELFQEASFRRLVPGIGRCAGSDAGGAAATRLARFARRRADNRAGGRRRGRA